MKTKTTKKEPVAKSAPTENDLLKALDDLEKGAVPSEMKDPDGGLATEGKSIAVSADADAEKDAKGVKKAAKKAAPIEESSASESSDSDSADSSPDDESESMSKAESASSDSSSSSASSASSMSKGGNTKKSFREVAEEDDSIYKAIEVSPFMESLVSATSDSMDALTKALDDLASGQQNFNSRLQKAVIAIGNKTVEQGELLKSLVEKLGGTPAPKREGKTILNKGDVAERQFSNSGEEGVDYNDPKVRAQVGNWLVKKAMDKEIPMAWVTTWESGMGTLPPDIMKSCENDLFKSDS